MDDDNRNRFVLDTSILVPVAIASGVALLIVIFLYCCRHYVQNKIRLTSVPRTLGDTRARDRAVTERRASGQRQHRRDGMAAIQNLFLPWSEDEYYQRHMRGTTHGPGHLYPPASSNRANYNSTQNREVHIPHTNPEHVESTGPTPSAPPAPVADAPPSYSVATRYPAAGTAHHANIGHTTMQPNVHCVVSRVDVDAPPPPYSPHTTAH